MTRYIDADALESKKFISWTCPEFFDEGAREQQAYQIGWNNAIETVMENEPTADVVEVVRCKDCKWHHDQSGTTKYLPCMALITPGRWFCADGERKENDKID